MEYLYYYENIYKNLIYNLKREYPESSYIKRINDKLELNHLKKTAKLVL